METKRYYGWKPSVPDVNDKMYALHAMQSDSAAALPSSAKTSQWVKGIFDQGELGSCTANAGAQFVRMLLGICGKPDIIASRLAIYYEERKLEKSIKEDSGATITDCFKVLSKQGVFPESEWPYEVGKFKTAPPKASVKEALKNLIDSYQRLDNTNITELKTCIAAGFPIEFGFSVYPEFESASVAKTGLVPLPKKGEQLLGGHANVICDYDDNKMVHGEKGAFYCVNSWGSQWGINGFYWISYKYLTNPNLADDFWSARLAT